VLCKNSNERTLQSFSSEAFFAELRLIAEHFSRASGRADFLITKENWEAFTTSHKRGPNRR
jgi:hypothetical protein